MNNNRLAVKYGLITLWIIIFVVCFVLIFFQGIQGWRIWAWEIVSLVNVLILYRDIKKINQNKNEAVK